MDLTNRYVVIKCISRGIVDKYVLGKKPVPIARENARII